MKESEWMKKLDEMADDPDPSKREADPFAGLEEDPGRRQAIEEALKQERLQATREVMRQVHALGRRQVLDAAERAQEAACDTGGSLFGATIIRRALKLSAAAACLGVLVWLSIPADSAVALARVFQQIENVRTVTFTTRVVTLEGGEEKTASRQKAYQAAGLGIRRDYIDDQGNVSITDCLSLARSQWISVYHQDRTYERRLMTEEEHERMTASVSPSGWIEALRSCAGRKDARNLGRRVIDGRSAEGFEWTYLHPGNRNLKKVIRLWVDVDALLPVKLVEESHTVSTGEHSLILVSEAFEWDPPIDPGRFDPVIPEGYVDRKADKPTPASEAYCEQLYQTMKARLPEDAVQTLLFTMRHVQCEGGQERTTWFRKTCRTTEQGSRRDSFHGDGTLWWTEFSLPRQSVWVNVYPGEKSYERREMARENMPYLSGAFTPHAFLSNLQRLAADPDHRSLGESEIKGKKAEGVEWESVPSEAAATKTTHRIYLEVETRLPVLLVDETRDRTTDRVLWKEITEDFLFDVPVDPDRFDPKIPEDYRERNGD